jgi:hypothetical protein
MQEILVSIDPGLVNLGFCVLEIGSERVVQARRIVLFETQKCFKRAGEQSIIQSLYLNLFVPNAKHFRAAKIVLVERQMKRTFIIIQYCIAMFCRENGIPFMFVDPKVVKRALNTSTIKTTRKGKATNPTIGKSRGNYRLNKKKATALAKKLYPELFSDTVEKQDDIADSILQGVWYSRVKSEEVIVIY